ncbi:MAG: RelA/SpoT family protein [Muribaculaceae bacterium]|nr:RelA/SpoT family protein [Muribaculaceae bacterium]
MEEYNKTPLEEEAMIQESFNDLLNGYLKSNHRKKVEIIVRAFEFAKEAHKGIRRRSGEPYILHPIAVARIASQEIGLGSTSICAALLHDVVEDTEFTVEDIEQHFGKKIAQLVSGLTKISGGIFGAKASAQAENFRKLLLTMSDDIRVVLIKMADRLHNMRTLGSMAPAKQYKIAGETLYIYAPLAHRLGLFAIKTELEDLSFKYEHPVAYKEISEKIKATEQRRNEVYTDFAAPILEKLTDMGIKFDAKARMKSVYSIWNKMESKHIPFEEVYDLYAMRIIFECDDQSKEKQICWSIYTAITELYRLHPERTRDWLSIPKANGYQALHLTVMGPDGNWVEIQIRSQRMDQIAEKGFAAHWKYKIGEGDEESELNAWLQTIKEILDNPDPNAIDFLDTVKLNLFATEIVVFTPKGELLTLPAGASVLDVAFNLHTQLGFHCIAGKVNHKLVPLSQKLKSGDQVEVLTSKSQKPKEEWVSFLASAKAKTRLRQALKQAQRPTIDVGKDLYETFLKNNDIKETNESFTKLLGTCKVANRDELYLRIGNGEITLGDYVVRMMKKQNESLLSRLIFRRGKKAAEEQAEVERKNEINRKETYILRSDENGANYTIASCCNPIPGDNVIGFINDNNEVEVHSIDCPRALALKASFGTRLIQVKWDVQKTFFPAQIHIEGIDRFGILQELTQMISSHLAIDIRKMNIEAVNEVFHCDLWIKVADNDVVKDLCNKVATVKGVKQVTRIL